MSKAHHMQRVAKFESKHGLPMDSNGGYLQPMAGLKVGDQSLELTNPYGMLEWCIGSGEDFYCFDWTMVNSSITGEELFVLDSAINSQTGGFIQAGINANLLVTPEDAMHAACDCVNAAIDWTGENEVCHTRKGWNQEPYYFFRCVFVSAAQWIKKVEGRDIERLDKTTDRELRFGSKRLDRLIAKYFGYYH